MALAMLARRLGLDSVYLLYDESDAGDVSWANPFRRTAAGRGIGIAGTRRYDDELGPGFPALAETIARSGADGVFIAGPPPVMGRTRW